MGRRASLSVSMGKDYDPEADYIISIHRDKALMLNKGYAFVCEIPDSTNDPDGTMAVFDRNPKPERVRIWNKLLPFLRRINNG